MHQNINFFINQWLFCDVAGVPQAFRCYQWPPVMRLGVSRMETEGHVFLIPIFESKRHGEDLEYNDAGDDSEVNLVEDEKFVTTSIQNKGSEDKLLVRKCVQHYLSCYWCKSINENQ